MGTVKVINQSFIAAILFCLMTFLPLAGQEYSAQFYTTNEGLAENEVKDIFQDSRGFFWFAAGDGVSRFDGQQFLTFGVNEGIDIALTSRVIEDSSGTIWVTGRKEVYFLKKDSLKFTKLQQFPTFQISNIGLLPDGRLIISTNNAGFFDVGENRAEPVFLTPDSAYAHFVYQIFTQKDGITFLSVDDLIYRYYSDGQSQLVANVPVGRLNRLMQNKQILYIATTLGAYSLDLQSRSLIPLLPSTTPYNCLDIIVDSFGYLWLATNHGLLYREPGSSDVRLLRTNTIPYISNTWYWRVFEDRVNNLWFSPAGYGIGKINYRFFINYTQFSGMPSSVHWLIDTDPSGRLWLAGPNGVDLYSSIEVFPSYGEKHLSGYDIRSLAILNDHQAYFAANNQGLFWADLNSGKTIRLYPDPEDPDLIVYSVFKGSADTIFVGTEKGLYEKKGSEFSKINMPGDKESPVIWLVKKDYQDNIWLGTDNGLYGFSETDEHKWKHWGTEEGLKFNNVKSIEPTRDGHVWVAYFEAGGATKIDINQTNVVRQLNIADGLPTDKVFTLLMDLSNLLWLGTSNGLCRLNGDKIDVFGVNQGILWVDFWRNAVFADKDSTLWFATSLGLSRFLPRFEKYPDEKLQVIITGAWSNEDQPKKLTDEPVEYSENFIRIRYAALDFKSEKEIEYEYKLLPVNEEWKKAPGGIIEFRSLAPGGYSFEIRASEPGRVSSDNVAGLEFSILPPFFLKPIFLVVFGIMAIAIIWIFYNFKTRQIRERNLLLNSEVENRTKDLAGKNKQLQKIVSKLQKTQAQLVHSEKMASLGLLSAGLAHEINNPLSFAVTNALYLKSEFGSFLKQVKLSDAEKENLKEMLEAVEAIFEGSKRVEDVVNNLQSFAKPQEAEYKKTNLNENLESTLKLLRARYSKRIKFELKLDEKLPAIYCYPSLLNQVFLNLLLNSIQAIKDKGKVTITTEVYSKTILRITFIDTGNGIEKKIENRVYDPFFTTKPVGTGTGLGLAISHSIITGKHRGSISFESEIGKGTTFILQLPRNLPSKPIHKTGPIFVD